MKVVDWSVLILEKIVLFMINEWKAYGCCLLYCSYAFEYLQTTNESKDSPKNKMNIKHFCIHASTYININMHSILKQKNLYYLSLFFIIETDFPTSLRKKKYLLSHNGTNWTKPSCNEGRDWCCEMKNWSNLRGHVGAGKEIRPSSSACRLWKY